VVKVNESAIGSTRVWVWVCGGSRWGAVVAVVVVMCVCVFVLNRDVNKGRGMKVGWVLEKDMLGAIFLHMN